MAGTRELRIQIIGDASSALGAFRSIDQGSAGLAGKLKSRLGLAAAGAFAGAGAGAVAFGKASVTAFADAQTQQAKLDQAFRKFPQLAGKNAEGLRKLNSQLMRKTKFDDDATASGQAVLAQFGLTEDQLKKMTPLLQDYASRTGKDLPTAAQDLGKAIMGQGRALKAIGLDFKDTGSAAGNFDQLMGGLRDKVGGFANNEGKTAAGRLAILQNQFGELQEKVGEKLLPILVKLASWLVEDGIPFLERFGRGCQKIGAALQDAWQKTETFREIVAAAFRVVVTVGDAMKDALVGAFRTIVDKFLMVAEKIAGAAAKAFGWVPGLGGKLKDAARAIEKFRDDANAALNGIKDKEVKINMRSDTPGALGWSVTGGAPPLDRMGGPTLPERNGVRGPFAPSSVTNNVTNNVTVNANELDPNTAGDVVGRNLGWRLAGVGGL